MVQGVLVVEGPGGRRDTLRKIWGAERHNGLVRRLNLKFVQMETCSIK